MLLPCSWGGLGAPQPTEMQDALAVLKYWRNSKEWGVNEEWTGQKNFMEKVIPLGKL